MTHRRSNPRRSPRARRGSVYLIVLSSMSVALFTVTAGVLAARAHAARASALADAQAASRAAESGLEAVLASMKQTIAWRQTVSGPFSFTLPDGAVAVALSDPVDGRLADDSAGVVELLATGTKNNARRLIKVRATPNLLPHNVMSYGLLVSGAVTFTTSSWWSRLPIHSNTSIGTSGTCSITGTMTAVGAVPSSGITPAATSGAAAVTLPVYADVLSEYAAIGSTGTMSGTGAVSLQYALISPVSPPWALSANTAGVYVIDCAGRRLTIQDCRINGTLICKNATGGVRITGTVLWDPAVAGYPCLLTDGAISITTTGDDLSEATASKNFNPIGAAYNGSADADTADVYPSEFRGLIWAGGALTMSGAFASQGPLIIGGTATITNTTGVTRGVTPTSGPPALRASPDFSIDRTTWARQVD